jgi:hypothetical protein
LAINLGSYLILDTFLAILVKKAFFVMPKKVTKKTTPAIPVAGQVTTGLPMTESEKYYTERERYFQGKRTFEIPDENYYSLEQRAVTK